MINKISPTMLKVLNTLNDGLLHTGSDIANSLGISRTAVWKIIKRLKKYDIKIQTQHQGYLLNNPHVLLQKKKIDQFIKDPNTSLEIFESLPSTSDYLKSKHPLKNKSICLSEYQTHGKGRLGREWVSPFGRNIYFSLSYTFAKDISEMSGLSLAVGVLAANTLKTLNPNLNLSLKWPNDLYIHDQKVGGILIDLIAEAHGNCVAIISMGLNVNMKNEQLRIDQPWTSLEHVLDENLDRNKIVGHLLPNILEGMDEFANQGFESFMDQWKSYDYLHNKRIQVTMGDNVITGFAKGIDSKGLLILELPSGIHQKLSCGDTALLKN